jgi:hypothetical protein
MSIKFIAGHVVPEGGLVQVIFPPEYPGNLLLMKTRCLLEGLFSSPSSFACQIAGPKTVNILPLKESIQSNKQYSLTLVGLNTPFYTESSQAQIEFTISSYKNDLTNQNLKICSQKSPFPRFTPRPVTFCSAFASFSSSILSVSSTYTFTF